MGLHSVILVFGIVCMAYITGQKTTYNMDDRADCNMAGYVDVGNTQTFYINAKQSASSGGVSSCRIDFQAADVQRLLKVEFQQYYFSGVAPCSVTLYMFYDGFTQASRTYNCITPRPTPDSTGSRRVSIRLDKGQSIDYNFQIVLTTYVDLPGGGGGLNNGDNQLNPGVIVGIVAGVVVILVVLLVIVCCCCRRKHGRRDEEAKERLGDQEPSSHSVGYVNENGRLYSDNDIKPKVTTFDGPGSPRTRNVFEYKDSEKPPMLSTFDASPTRNQNFKYSERAVENKWKNETQDEQDDNVPQSPLLAAIRNSARYKSHYHDTEVEAEERSRKFSKSSSAPSSPGAEPPTPPPSLPVLPRENILRSPQKPPGPKQASIRRAPRPTSSNEEIARIDNMFDTQEGDENIQIIPDSPLEKSQPGGVVPIQTADPHTPSPQRRGPFNSAAYEPEEYYDEDEIKLKSNTQHTLRPNRKRSPGAEKRKPPETEIPKQNKKQLNNQSGRQPGNGRLASEAPDRKEQSKKKSQKSPRLGSLRKPRPSAASRLDDEDPPPSRPDTPTSVVAKGFRTDDLMGFSPLQRTGSRQSLYASRSSLYGRRGRRDRSSFSESVASYAHDDIDVYRHRRGDDEDRPITQKDRYFKSLGDIHYGGPPREQSTQTLRETATQTGSGMVTHSKARRASQRKSPKSQRAMSSSATQTKQNKQSDSEPKTPLYAKALPKTKKNAKNTDTGVGTNSSAKTTNGKQKSNGRPPDSTVRPKTPEPVQSETQLAPRARTPDNDIQHQPISAPSPLTSVPATYAPPIPPNYLPPVAVYQPQPVPSDEQQQPFHSYTPPPIHNYSAPPRSAPSPAPYGAPVGRSAKSPWELLCDLTDGEYQGRAQSRGPGSQVESSHSGHPKQPFHPGFRQPEHFDNSQHPDRSAGPSRSQTPGFPSTPGIQQGRPDSAQSEPHTYNNLDTVPQPTMYPKKSSWEQLKQLTDSEYKLTYGASTYEHSESNV